MVFDPEREINTCKAVPPHKNIIRLLDHEVQKRSLILVMELCEVGDVEEYFPEIMPSSSSETGPDGASVKWAIASPLPEANDCAQGHQASEPATQERRWRLNT